MTKLIIHYDRRDKAILRNLKNSILSTVSERALMLRFPLLVEGAIKFVLDTPTTGRTTFEELDNVERTFLGLKIEHYLRKLLEHFTKRLNR